MSFKIENVVQYHYEKFPPQSIDYTLFTSELLVATEALSRFDQMLKNLHNNEIILAPLRNQEALLSSRMEGTINTMDEIMEFEAMHPFQDGSGRIARMLIRLNLWKSGLLSQPHFYISGNFEQYKEEYMQTMRNVSTNGDWNTWIQFFLVAVKHQAEKNLEIAEQIRELYENTKTEFSDLLSSKWNLGILDYIFTYPVFRNNKLVKQTGISNATALGMVKKLVEKNYLKVREEASGRRAGLYSFEPLMQLVRV